MAIRLQTSVPSLPGLLARLSADRLLRKPIRALLSRVGKAGRAAGKVAAPVGATRQLSSNITFRVSAKQIPTFVAIVASARSRQGFPYPKLLEFSPKHKRKGWLSTPLEGVVARLAPDLEAAARDIESEFGAP